VKRLDLNLLPIVIALYEEHAVNKTATRLGMSQPAVSAALARLRKAFDDPLFVRTAHGMEPTPRVHALIVPARDVLSRVERDVLAGLAFDPATANTTFTFALSDVGEMVFLPRIMERLQTLAPLASVRSVALSPSDVREGLETGEVDLAVGYFPDLETTNFFQQRLFTHHFCCLLRADHRISSKRLSMKQYLGLRHVAVHAAGRKPGDIRSLSCPQQDPAEGRSRHATLHVAASDHQQVGPLRDGSTRHRDILRWLDQHQDRAAAIS
jgi:DNA-binding transcriptional LysR family regulator